MEYIFCVGLSLMICSGALAHAINEDVLKRPQNNIPLMAVCGIASLAAFPFLVLGFFVFDWKIALIALVVSFLIVPFVYQILIRRVHAAGFAILVALLGLLAGAACILVRVS